MDENAPIPYDGPEDGPYDPNDDAAVDRFFHYAISRGPRERTAGVASVRLDIADDVLESFKRMTLNTGKNTSTMC